MIEITREDIRPIVEGFDHVEWALEKIDHVYADGTCDRDEFDVEVIHHTIRPLKGGNPTTKIFLVWKNDEKPVQYRQIITSSPWTYAKVLTIKRLGNRRVDVMYKARDIHYLQHEEYEIPHE